MTAAKVRLIPGDHAFSVEGEETILEAALRAGLSVDYGCSNGNCGDCRARVLEGEVRKVRPHDYVFNETQKQQGYTLMCSVTPVTDLILEAGLAEGPEQIPLQRISATVRGIERPGRHVLVLRLQTPRTQRLRFLAGQSVRLSLGESLSATLPLANCPCDDRNLVFHLDALKEDAFTVHCLEQLSKGAGVSIEGPQGDFVLTEEHPGPLIFLAMDTGFGPVHSLVEHVLAQETGAALDLLWMASEERSHYEDNLCRSWNDVLDGFRYQALRIQADDQAGGVIQAALQGLADAPQREAFVAGPESFVQAGLSELEKLGVPASRCRHLVL
ncbi:MAG: 2Fe-2S iron-sulfur cluster-binding protein [Thioalkalivibrio sp.]